MIKKIVYLGLAASCALAAGYKIPEQSGDSIALSSSNVATSFGADSAYYNPANMPFLDSKGGYVNISGTYIHLNSSKFTPDVIDKYNYPTSSRSFSTFVPTFHFVSPEFFNGLRFGVSMVVPAGLGMRWDDDYPASTAKLFLLKVMELSPSIAYKFNNVVSVGAGLRYIHAIGDVKSEIDHESVCVKPGECIPLQASREVHGKSNSFGYNLAITIRPTSNLSLAATYRSKVNMKLKGQAQIYSTVPDAHFAAFVPQFIGSYTDGVSIKVPLPAALNLAIAYKLHKVTMMFDYEKTYWSSLKNLYFTYPSQIPLEPVFGVPVPRNWKNSTTYRFGLAYQATDALRLMGGFGFEKTVANSNDVGFELPDANAKMYSIGANYKINDNMSVGASFLYLDRAKRHLNHFMPAAQFANMVGYMKAGNVAMFNTSLEYKF